MNIVAEPCPHLPAAPSRMDWRHLRAHGGDRGPAFVRTSLEYAQYLWQRGHPARAILCLDRALGAEAPVDVGRDPSPPYAALAWMLTHAPPGRFLGNPRVHFEHLALRVSGPRRERRRWRAWACWAISRRVRPALPGDPKCAESEPALATIAAQLAAHGSAAEADLWQEILTRSQPISGRGACGPDLVSNPQT